MTTILKERSEQYRDFIQIVLTTFYGRFHNEPQKELFESIEYSLLAPGKRLRPIFCFEFCRMAGGEWEKAAPFAAAVEMIHNYSLIHDDLPCMDNDDFRRGRPTNHKVYGEAVAILAGDGLLTDAFSVVASNTHVSEAGRLAAVSVLSCAAGSTGMVGGQVMDMRGERERLSLDTLLSLHARKTGAMICASVQLGALAAGCEMGSDAWDALTRYAERIGLAFQVIDDVLDATADPSLLGKSVGKDARADKTTFLTYYTIDEAKAYAKKLTEEACLAVEGIDREGTLSALARYLAERIY
jgi:geranylgeranyl diphosphate synthase type II